MQQPSGSWNEFHHFILNRVWLCPGAILDLFSRSQVSWKLSTRRMRIFVFEPCKRPSPRVSQRSLIRARCYGNLTQAGDSDLLGFLPSFYSSRTDRSHLIFWRLGSESNLGQEVFQSLIHLAILFTNGTISDIVLIVLHNAFLIKLSGGERELVSE